MNLPPGYTMRPPTTADIPQIVDVLNALSIEAIGVRDTTEQSIRDRWNDPTLEPSTDVIVVEHHGMVVGYEAVHAIAPFADADTEGAVHPDHRGIGLGTALVTWAIDRLGQNIPHAPDHIRMAPHFYTFDGHAPSEDLLRSFGMTHVRTYYEMIIEFDGPPPPPALPDTYRMIPFSDPSIDERAAFRAMRDAFRDHYGFVERPFEDGFTRLKSWQSSPDYDPGLWWELADGDDYVGNIWCWPQSDTNPGHGYVANLGVRPEWRRQGLATGMLLHAFGEFFRRGMTGVDLGVDAASLTGATRVYEKVGMNAVHAFNAFELVLRDGEDITRS